TLRTVKVSRAPPPWRRITTPWKIWIRVRLPSVTRTCTLSVSPGRKSGTSVRIAAFSISWIRVCMAAVPHGRTRASRGPGRPAWGRRAAENWSWGAVRSARTDALVCHIFAVNRKTGLAQDGAVPIVEFLRGEAFQQLGAGASGAAQGLVASPAGDGAGTSRQEDVGDGAAAPDGRLGVDGALQQRFHGAGGEGVVGDRVGVAEDAGQEAPDRLHHDEDGDLPAGEDEVAEADLVDGHAGAGLLGDAGVDALVAAAREHQPGLGGVPHGVGLRERPSARRGNDQPRDPGGRRGLRFLWWRARAGRAPRRIRAARSRGGGRVGGRRVRGRPVAGHGVLAGRGRAGGPGFVGGAGFAGIGPVRVLGRDQGVEGLAPGFRLHDHAGAAAVRGVVDRAVPVVGPFAQVVDVDVEEAGAAGLAEEGDVEDVEALGEDRDDVDSHRSPCGAGAALRRVRNGALRGDRARLPRAAGPAPGTRRRNARCRAAAYVSRTRDGRRRGPGSLARGGFKRGRAA